VPGARRRMLRNGRREPLRVEPDILGDPLAWIRTQLAARDALSLEEATDPVPFDDQRQDHGGASLIAELEMRHPWIEQQNGIVVEGEGLGTPLEHRIGAAELEQD